MEQYYRVAYEDYKGTLMYIGIYATSEEDAMKRAKSYIRRCEEVLWAELEE